MVSASLLFLGAGRALIPFPPTANVIYGENSNLSVGIHCPNDTSISSNKLHANFSVTLKGVNSTNATIISLQGKKGLTVKNGAGSDVQEGSKSTLNSTMKNETANLTTGTGELIGSSKAVKPSSGTNPQNQEPERLVPNPQAFQEAKNEANSPCPPGRLLKSLENKNVVQP